MNEPTDRNAADLDRALGELQAHVDGFVKRNPRSKANNYFKELETSINKKVPIGLLRKVSTKLELAFPTGQDYEVKKLLEKLFDCYQVIDNPTGQANQCLDEQERMAQRTTGYTFTEFRDEMLTLINRYCSSKLTEKYNALERDYKVFQIKPAQEGALDQLRLSAVDLQDFLKDKITNVSQGCAAFLQELTYAGTSVFGKDQPKSQDQLPHQEGFEEMQRKMMTELENTKSHFRKKLREAKEEADSWKTQLEMTAEDNAKQKQRLSEELHRLHGENRQLKSRSSSSIFLQSLNQSMRVKDFDAKKMLKDIQPAEPLEKELFDSFVLLKEENARLSKNNERTTELEAQLRNTMNSFDAHKNETIERENYMQNQFEEMQRKMMTEFENTKSSYGKKLREARDEADQWKTQLEMMAEDNAKQTQRLSVEIHGDRQLKSRMTQRTTDYTFTNFQAEIAAMIKRYCSSILQEKYNAFERDYEGIQIRHVQEGAFNQLRQSVIDLRNFLQDGNYNVSAGCIAFLQDMINGAPELVKDHPKSQDQLPHQDGSSNLVGGSKATLMYSTKPEADKKK